MRDKVKRFISILMTALMLVNLLPVGALADGIASGGYQQATVDNNSQTVYVYVKVKGNISGLDQNKDHWYTIGTVTIPNMPDPSNYKGSNNGEHVDSVELTNNKGRLSVNDVKGNISHTKNTTIPLEKATWTGIVDGQSFGFVRVNSGATGYVGGGWTWHLDGYVDVNCCKVTYKPGEYGAFEAKTYDAKHGDATPAFGGETTGKPGWKFDGWEPEVAKTVTGNATYTAKFVPKTAAVICTIDDTQKGYGTVSSSYQTILQATGKLDGGGSVSGSTATAYKGYKFVCWYKVTGEDTYEFVTDDPELTSELAEQNLTQNEQGLYQNTVFAAKFELDDYAYTVEHYWIGDKDNPDAQPFHTDADESQTAPYGSTVKYEENGASWVIMTNPVYTFAKADPEKITISADASQNVLKLYYYKNVKLIANSETNPYNGEEQHVFGYTCTVAEKQQDGSVEYVPWTGEKPLTFEGISASGLGKDVNENGYPVTFNDTPIGENNGLYYVIESQTGTLTITPAPVTLQAPIASKTYDGTPLKAEDYGHSFVEGLDFADDFASISVEGSQTQAGSSVSQIKEVVPKKGKDLKNYKLTFLPGTLTIAKRSVLLTSQSATKTYDGSALTRPAVTITGDGFVPGELAKVEATGSITNVGSTPNAIQYTTTGAFNPANYSIALSVGTLTVTAKPEPEPRRTFNLTVNYVYQNGKRAAASYNRGGLKNGETFDITSPVIAGYTASETVVSGTIDNRDIKVTVIYTADGVNLDDYGVPLGLGNITMNVGDCFE